MEDCGYTDVVPSISNHLNVISKPNFHFPKSIHYTNMKTTVSPHWLLLAALFLFCSSSISAQNGHSKLLSLFKKKAHPALDCNNDVTAPDLHCPMGNCLPGARAAYLITYDGEPWGLNDNLTAMDAVFGSGNWDHLYLEEADPASLLSPAYKVIFLEGSATDAGYVLQSFLNANSSALENWVAAGGALYIHIISNSPSSMNFGFDGVMFQNDVWGYQGIVQTPAHPIFNGPFTPANGDFYGNYIHYGAIVGNAGLGLLLNENGAVILSEKTWGVGKVIFSTLYPPYWVGPSPNSQNMWSNILANLNAVCETGKVVPADAGTCVATIADQTLDATATDDCAVVSLTHDFAAAPSNTTLNGAVFPAGSTLVRWTATDAANNVSTCEFMVIVREPEAAVITCPGNMLMPADVNACGVSAVNFTVTATDNCTPEPTIVTVPAAGSAFPNGTTTVTAVATDVSGNTSTCSFVVTVVANPEICNGIDDDCNGQIDDGAPADNTFYADLDGDGYGNLNSPIAACLQPSGYVANSLDCDDTNYYIQPGMSEYCDGIDNNCDGSIDEGVKPIWYADADGDGYGDLNVTKLDCNQPTGYTSNSIDCDDTNAYIHPDAQEDCTNFTDENCDGILGSNAFAITATHTDVFCGSTPDGTISITMSPAQNYTTILWSNGVCCTTTQSNLQAGTYKVTVSNECGTTKTETIAILPSPTPTLEVTMTGTNVLCYGDGNATVTATPKNGCGGYTYAWNNSSTDANLSGLSGGTYSVVVTDNCGCTQTGTFTVQEAVAPLELYSGSIIALLDGNYWVQVLPYSGTSPYKFRRSIPAGGFTAWSNSNGFSDVAPGTYTFEVEDANGCTAQLTLELSPFTPPPANISGENTTDQTVPSEKESADLPVADRQSEISAEKALAALVFPNPTDGELNIEWSGFGGKSASIQIVSQMGQVLHTLTVPDNAMRVMTNVSDLPGGIYFVKILAADQQVKTVRFVKS